MAIRTVGTANVVLKLQNTFVSATVDGLDRRARLPLVAMTLHAKTVERASQTVGSIIVSAQVAGVVAKTVRMQPAATTVPARTVGRAQQMEGSIIVSA